MQQLTKELIDKLEYGDKIEVVGINQKYHNYKSTRKVYVKVHKK